MADALLDELAPSLVRAEWRVLQDYVTGKKQRPTGRGVGGWVKGLIGGAGGEAGEAATGGGGGEEGKKVR